MSQTRQWGAVNREREASIGEEAKRGGGVEG